MNKNLFTTIGLMVVLLVGGGYAVYEYTDVFDNLGKSEKVNVPEVEGKVDESIRLFEGIITKDNEGDFAVLGIKLKSKENLSGYEGQYVVMEGKIVDEKYFQVSKIEKATSHQESIAEQKVINLEGEVNSSGNLLVSDSYGEFVLTGDNSTYAGELMLFSIQKEDDGNYSIVSAQKLELISGAFSIVDKEKFIYKIGNIEFTSSSEISMFFEEGSEGIAFVSESNGKKVFYKPVTSNE